MTNAEKLNCLTDRPCTVCKYHKENGCSKWSCVFEQEPTTKNDLGVDLISRADAIKAMQEKSKKLKNLDTINGLCGAVAILYDMPSVTPQEQKTGHWEYGYAFPDGQYCRCSECEELIKCIYPMHYCPNCGAKMAESEGKDG